MCSFFISECLDDYDDLLLSLLKVGTGFDSVPAHSLKRTHDEAMADAKTDRAKRHRFYLKRHRPGVKFGSWRPTKMYRVKAKHWCMAIDSQLRSVTACVGLLLFLVNAELKCWQDPFTWPFLSVSMDLGSDGNSGYHALERF